MKKKNQKQQGNVLLLLIPILTVLVLFAMGAIWWMSTNHKAVPKQTESSVSADDEPTNGNANADLAQDVRILDAGIVRDKSFVASTNTALSDEPQPVLND